MVMEKIFAWMIREGDLIATDQSAVVWKRVCSVVSLSVGKLSLGFCGGPGDQSRTGIQVGHDDVFYRRGKVDWEIVEAVVPSGMLQYGETLEWRRARPGEECMSQGSRVLVKEFSLEHRFVIVRREQKEEDGHCNV
jgi:hypothetical protein